MKTLGLWPTPSVATATGGQTSRGGDRKGEKLLTGMAREGGPILPPPSAQLTLFAADSPVSHGARPDSDEARMTTAISGRKCADSLARYSQLGYLAKMLLESSVWASTRCYLTWKHSVTPAKRLLFRLVPSMPRTGEIESGSSLIATATANQLCPSMAKHPGCREMMPTPKGSPSRPDFARTNREGSGGHDLMTYAALHPTPDAHCYKSGERGTGTGGGEQLSNHAVAPGQGGSLCPGFVEWLMGFPKDWTEI